MSTTTIGPYEVYWAEWKNANEDVVHLILDEQGIAYASFPITDLFYTEDIVDSEIPIRPHRPSIYHNIWNDGEQKWEINQTTFTNFLKSELSTYRDLRVEGTLELHPEEEGVWVLTPVNEVYNNGVENFVFSNDSRTRGALEEKMAYLPIVNDPILTVNFKTKDGFKQMSGSDLQGAFTLLSGAAQLRFDAEEHVLTTHGSTPYEFLADAIEDYETYITNNS